MLKEINEIAKVVTEYTVLHTETYNDKMKNIEMQVSVDEKPFSKRFSKKPQSWTEKFSYTTAKTIERQHLDSTKNK